jgi:hypothetical protein
MAERELIIKVNYNASQAQVSANQFHRAERARIAQTAAATQGAACRTGQAQAAAQAQAIQALASLQAQMAAHNVTGAAIVRGVQDWPQPPPAAARRQSGPDDGAVGATGLGEILRTAAQSQATAREHFVGLTEQMKATRETVGAGDKLGEVLDAGVLLRGISLRNPTSPSAHTRALLRDLRRADASPKEAAELGLKPGMEIWQQLEAMQAAADRTTLDSGLRGGTFTRVQVGAATMNPETARRATAEYLAGREGQARRDATQGRAGELEHANRYAALQHFKCQAELGVVGSGELETSERFVNPWIMVGGQALGRGDRKELEIRAETACLLREGLSSNRAGRQFPNRPLTEGKRAAYGSVGPATESGATCMGGLLLGCRTPDELLATCANELVRLRQLAEQDRERREWAAAPSLSAPAPRPMDRFDYFN